MIKLTESAKIYLLCPPSISGGPEAIHQLAQKLRLSGHSTFVTYTALGFFKTFWHYYKEYAPVCLLQSNIQDTSQNLLIVPEIMTERLKVYRNIQKAVWWLSVDNHAQFVKWGMDKEFDFQDKNSLPVIHFAQSFYAESFLRKKGAQNIYPLSDYISKNHFRMSSALQTKDKNRVIFNGSSGKDTKRYMEKIIACDPSIEWVPLLKKSGREIIDLMRNSRLYIDFGTHPGKDRMPREASLHGCCVIAGRRGAAGNSVDMPLPQDYVFDTDPFDPDRVMVRVRECLDRYDEKVKDFDGYRNNVFGQEEKFEQEVADAFGKVNRPGSVLFCWVFDSIKGTLKIVRLCCGYYLKKCLNLFK